MPRGVPKAGFRMTQNRINNGITKPMLASRPMFMQPIQPMAPVVVAAPVVEETEAEIRAKLTERFEALTDVTHAAIDGTVRAFVISGPAGLGKSSEVTRVLEERNPFYTVISGFVRPTGLYKTLYEYRHKGSVVVFDDADSIFNDEISLNMLKKACDTTKKRNLSWLAESKMEDEDGERLPRTFEFEGTVIFITNYDFDDFIARGSRLSPHFEALVSRSMYLDLKMKTRKDYLTRIKMKLEDGMLRSRGLSQRDEDDVVRFIEKNADSLRELSLRIVIKIADLRKAMPGNWETRARVMCCK